MRIELVLFFYHPLTHFNYRLKEKVGNTKLAWHGKFYLEPQLIK